MNTGNFTVTSAYCQLISEESVDVMRDYFEYALKYKQGTDSSGIGMLDLIRNTVISPFGQYLVGKATTMSILDRLEVLDINNPAAAIKKYRENLPTYAGKLAEDISTFYQLED